MLISSVEEGIENLLRETLPLPSEHGDISFEPPSSTWSATVNRLTINLFLYGVGRSSQPSRVQPDRRATDGTITRRAALPMVQLSYLVSAWAGSPRDEHELLGDTLVRLLVHAAIPVEHLPTDLESPVQLAVSSDEHNRPRELWSGLGGTLKASFVLTATVAADAFAWEAAAPLVERVSPALRQSLGSRAP